VATGAELRHRGRGGLMQRSETHGNSRLQNGDPSRRSSNK
jgi:hypothetical protein